MATLLIACRLVESDQWLVTHIDSTWYIYQVKQWILNKCKCPDVDPIELPHFRPGSPIVFSGKAGSSDDDYDDLSSMYTVTTAIEDDSTISDAVSEIVRPYSRSKIFNKSSNQLSKPPGKTRSTPPESVPRHTLLQYSTQLVMEDNRKLFEYEIRHNELLELHPPGLIVSLQRGNIEEYIKPYYDSWVKELRWAYASKAKKSSMEYGGSVADGKDYDSQSKNSGVFTKKRSGEIMSGSLKSKESEITPKKWYDCRVTVSDTFLEIARLSDGGEKTEKYHLSCLTELSGSDRYHSHIQELSGRISPSVTDHSGMHVLTAVFDTPSPESPISDTQKPPMVRSRSKPKMKRPATQPSDAASQNASSPTLSNNSPFSQDLTSVSRTVKLDMLTEHAFNNIIRILHRHGSPKLKTSLRPSFACDLYYNPSPFSSRPNSPLASSPTTGKRSVLLTLEYPGWRMRTVIKAQRAGIGAISGSVERLIFQNREPLVNDRKFVDTKKPTGAPMHHFTSDDMGSDESEGEDASEVEFADWTLDPAVARLSQLTVNDETNEARMEGITSRLTNYSNRSGQLSHPPSADSLTGGRPRGLTSFSSPPRRSVASSSSSEGMSPAGSLGRKRSATTTVSPKSSDASLSNNAISKRTNMLTRFISNDRVTKAAHNSVASLVPMASGSNNFDSPLPLMRRMKSGHSLSGADSVQSASGGTSPTSPSSPELTSREADALARARVWQRNNPPKLTAAKTGRTPVEPNFPF